MPGTSGGLRFGRRRSSGGRDYHGGYSAGGRSAKAPVISHRYYPGAARFVYYTKRGRVKELYASGRDKARPAATIGVCILMTLVTVPLVWLLLSIGVFTPLPLDLNSYDAKIVLEDRLGVGQTDGLTDALEAFRQATGVAPGLALIRDGEWRENSADLEEYALSEYARLFDDEKHFLALLSFPDEGGEEGFSGWTWEGMTGCECQTAFNTDSKAAFEKLLRQRLSLSSPETLADSLASVYAEFAASGMQKQVSTGYLVLAGAALLIYAVLMWAFIRDQIDRKRLETAVAVLRDAGDARCESCGQRYVIGSAETCPRCGAPIPLQTETK